MIEKILILLKKVFARPVYPEHVMMMLLASLLSASLIAQAHEIKFEKIFVSDFETLPTKTSPRIEFVSDRLQIFKDVGVAREAEVRVFDASGDLVADPQIEWTSSNSTALDITPIGGSSAELLSADTWFGTVEFQASYSALGLSVNGQAIMADPSPETVLIPSQWVLEILGDRLDRHMIKLVRNNVTEALRAGDFVVSGDLAGVMVAVAGTSIQADEVIIEADPALITESFDAFSATSTAQPVQVLIKLSKESARVTVKSVQTGEVLKKRTISGAGLLDSVNCSGGLQPGINVDFSALDLDMTLVPTNPTVQTTGGTIDIVEFGIKGTVSATAELSVNVSVDVSAQGECKIDLPNFLLPNVTLPPIFSIGPKIAPEMGVDIKVVSQAEAGWIPLSGLQRSWTLEAGVQYTAVGGWDSFSSFHSEGAEPNSDTFSIDAALALEAGANADMGVGLSFCLGHCALATELVSVNFLNLSGGPFWRFGIASPLDPSRADYVGPDLSSGVGAEASAGLEFAFFESGILKYIPVGGSAGFSFPLFSESFEFVSIPVLSGTVNCSPDCDAVPSEGGTIDVELNAETTDAGTAEFWFGPVSGQDLELLGTATFGSGQAIGSFGIDGLASGNYAVFPRLSLDNPVFWFTQDFPLGSNNSIGQFAVNGDGPVPQPVAQVSPSSFVFEVFQGVSDGDSLSIANVGVGIADLVWTIDEAEGAGQCGSSPVEVPWLSASPAAGTTPPASTVPVEVTVDTTGLSAGTFEAALCVSTNDPNQPLVEVAVTLTVLESQTVAQVSPSSFVIGGWSTGAHRDPTTATTRSSRSNNPSLPQGSNPGLHSDARFGG